MSQTEAINQVLQQMRLMQSKMNTTEIQQDNIQTFPGLLKDAVNQVNAMQQESSDLKTRFEKGDPKVSLSDVMLASQKSGLAFDATLQVRNKLIQAYQDIMNMPI